MQSIFSAPFKRFHLLINILIGATIFIAVWIPRRIDLNRAVTTDEILWLDRSNKFYFALRRGDLGSTYQKEHPGVTVMWLGTLGLLNKYQEFIDSNQANHEKATINYYVRFVYEQNQLENLVEDRILMSFVQAITLTIVFWITWGILGTTPAFIAILLLAFEPFHLALTRIFHLDGLLSSFYLLSILAFISYLTRRQQSHLILSGIAAGLSMLTKSPGFFLVPTIGILALIGLSQNKLKHEASTKLRGLQHLLKSYSIWLLSAALTFVILWPAMWVDPVNILLKILAFAEGYATEGHDTTIYFNGQLIESGSVDLQYANFYPVTYIWRTTPIVLFGLIILGLLWFFNHSLTRRPEIKQTIIALAITGVLFTIGMTFGSKKFDRYFLPAHAIFAILSGIGWSMFLNWIRQKQLGRFSIWVSVSLIAVVLGIQMYSALKIFPYNLAYYNPLLGGGSKAPEVMQIGWGEGLDQAAIYLNNKNNVKDIKAMSWYAWGPFSFFFNGQFRNIRTGDFTQEDWEELLSSDYVVIYIHQWQRNMPKELLEFLSKRDPEHSIWINQIEYARIYKIP